VSAVPTIENSRANWWARGACQRARVRAPVGFAHYGGDVAGYTNYPFYDAIAPA